MSRVYFWRWASIGVIALLFLGWCGVADARPGSEAPFFALASVAALAALALSPLRKRQVERAAVVLLPVFTVAMSSWVFGPLLREGRLGNSGDWAINEAIAREIYDAIGSGRQPAMLLGISAGDPTTDLYATAIHTVVAYIAYLFGSHTLIHHVMSTVAWLSYTLAAVAVVRLATRYAAPWTAFAIAFFFLFEMGSSFTWGVLASWYWGLFPSTVSIAMVVLAIPDLHDLARGIQRSQWVVRRIWLLLGLATALHPVGVLFVLTLAVSFAAEAMLQRRAQRAQRLMPAVHAAIGAAVTAPLWAPSAERLYLYAVHYGTPQIPVSLAFSRIVEGVLPDGSFPTLVTTAFAAGLVALVLRREASVAFLCAFVILNLYLEPAFLDLGLAISPTTVRLQSYRIGMFIVPLLYAGVGLVVSPRFKAIPSRASRMVAATLALAGLGWCVSHYREGAAALVDSHLSRVREASSNPVRMDDPGYLALADHLRARQQALAPGQYARAIYFADSGGPHEILHLYWDAGVPVIPRSAVMAGLFFREQPFDLNPANLERYAVRYAISRDNPPGLGDPSTQQQFGAYYLRELASWTGDVLHVREGGAQVRLAHLREDEIALDVNGASSLIEIGVPYYPRYEATQGGHPVDVLAMTGPPGRRVERTLAIRASSGRITLRPTRGLPSDRAGWSLAILALFGIATTELVARSEAQRLARLRERVMRGLGWANQAVAHRSFLFVVSAAVLVALAVLVRGQGGLGGLALSLRFGVLFPTPQITLAEQACTSQSWGRSFLCEDGTTVSMSVSHFLHDVEIGWAVPAPAIFVTPAHGNAEVQATLPLRIEGTYLAGGEDGCSGELRVGDQVFALPERATVELELPAASEASVTIRARRPCGVSVVRASAVDMDRERDVPFAILETSPTQGPL